ncbi:hypothetical protein FHR81_001370 [Actinoalloteichus hoggarensis]|uniref:Uncharacterized protein n=1 Tax=Actinoalloteichus hoggarensis TaxID=1470176 RepID=A0A221W013_9PSEU|nr:hypothetical protein [Actinoalloteichus hoggarensis]ASO19103.1 hypothetical protein AHOG_07275 [Actinoalloteichus hoggarensis]MBB5920340.1 hypothetical protein [Actinoalloteichus hoggarensis]
MLKWIWWLTAPAIAALLIVLAVRDARPAYEAAFGSGTDGVFTVTRVVSGGRGHAAPYGDFVPDDGSARRLDVALVPGGSLEPGERITAVDTGHPRGVYPAGGSADWLILTVVGGVGVLLLLAWAGTVVRVFVRRWAMGGAVGASTSPAKPVRVPPGNGRT